jgi:hypothetical protein
MDESHRLKPMGNYDQALFNKLFKEVTPLMKKISRQIDCRRYGVEQQDILSWVQTKFIFIFQRYHDTEPKYLKGYIIRGLQMYAMRLMSQAYQEKYASKLSTLDISDLYDEAEILTDEDPDAVEFRQSLLTKALKFLKGNLSDNAFLILQTEIDLPAYIRREMDDLGKSPNSKIPTELLAEYFGMDNKEGIRRLRNLRREISEAIEEASLSLI